jgi:hypothetical protein
LLALVSLGLVGLGGGAFWLQTHRDGGYVSAGSRNLATPGYALDSDRQYLGGGRWRVVGTVRVRATGRATTRRVFVGIAPADSAARYLTAVQYTSVNNLLFYNNGQNVAHAGGAPTTPPAASRIWTVQTSGTGTQTLLWRVKGGYWSVVVMNADGSPGVNVHADLGATLPPLPWVATGLVAGGALVLVGSVLLILVAIRRATRRA